MKHNIHLEGYAFSLRPVELEDAEFIVETRTPDRSRFMNPIERTTEAQQKWLEEYYQRPNDYYFVVERKKDRKREGLLGLYDFDYTNHSAQWGRVIIVPGSVAAAEIALLSFRVAFDIFDLNEVWGVVLAGNKHMIGYVEALGFEKQESLLWPIDGKMVEGIKYVLTKDRWKSFEKEIMDLALGIAD